MRLLLAVGACALLAGCESMSQKIDASRQERCHKADTTMGDRYVHICGDAYNDVAYKEGLQKGMARRPRPPV